MAKISIDIFSTSKQRKADREPVRLSRRTLVILAVHASGSWHLFAKIQREIKEDILTRSLSRFRAGGRVASPMSVVTYVTEGETRRPTHPKLERQRV